MMKELTLLGYFTSEVGATKALRYLPVPGRYDGNVPYKKGDRAWALPELLSRLIQPVTLSAADASLPQ